MPLFGLVAALTFYSSLLLAEQGRPDPRQWLEPCQALRTSADDDLELQKRLADALHVGRWPFPNSGEPLLQFLAEPAFASAWVVAVYKPEIGACKVVSTVADQNVYYANYVQHGDSFVMRRRPARITATTYRVDLPCSLAESLGEMWYRVLRNLRQRGPDDPIVVDGVSYTASSFRVGEGELCGATNTPPAASPASHVVRIGEVLLNYSREDDPLHAASSAQLDEAIAALKEAMK